MSARAGTLAAKEKREMEKTLVTAWKPATKTPNTAGKLITPWMRGLVRKQEFSCIRDASNYR
jgi:hypothetical protein